MWLGGECNVVKPLVSAGGSLLALATVVLDLIFYLASSAAKAAAGTAQVSLQQIPMGQQAYPSYPAYPVAYGQPMGNPLLIPVLMVHSPMLHKIRCRCRLIRISHQPNPILV
ncbi:unnamed protein product [Calypogeia fissa]